MTYAAESRNGRGALAAVVSLLWLSILSFIYSRAALKAVRSAFGGGGFVSVILLALPVSAAGLCWLRVLSVQFIVAATALLVGGAVTVILIASRTLDGAVVLIWLVWISWFIGSTSLDRVKARSDDLLARSIFATAVGLGIMSHATLGMALAGALQRWVALTALILVSMLSVRRLLKTAGSLPSFGRGITRVFKGATAPSYLAALAVLAGYWILFITIQSTAPETQHDALMYHLALPRLYIEHGRYIETPYSMQSWFYLGAEMNYLLAMLIGGEISAKLMHAVFFLLGTAATAAFSRALWGGRAALLAALLYATTPLVAWEASTASVDLALASYCILTLLAVFRSRRGQTVAWLGVAGLMAGFAVSVKVSALYFLLPVAVLVFLAAVRARCMRGVLAFAIVASISAAPWPLLRFVQTGNPVFPFYNQIFQSPEWPAGTPVPVLTNFGVGLAPLPLASLPWTLTFHSERFHEGSAGPALGLGFLLLPLLFLLGRVSKAILALVWVLGSFAFFWIFSAYQYLRFIIPALPVVAMISGYLLHRLASLPSSPLATRARFIVQAVLVVCVASNLPLTMSLSANIPERLPIEVALGRESREGYRARVIPSYGAYRAIKRRHPGERVHILAFWDEARLHAPGVIEPLWSPALPPLPNEPEAVVALQQHGITHIVINRGALPRSVRGFFLIEPPFLTKYATLEYRERGFEVYHLRYPAVPPSVGPRGRTDH
jgi:hypothetical protein